MSVIVACKKDGYVYLGADTQTTGGENTIFRDEDPVNYKIWVSSNGLIIGCSGSFKMHQEIQSREIFDFSTKEKFDKKYIVKNIIPKLYKLCEESNYFSDDDKIRMKASILIASLDKIYCIKHTFQVCEYEKFASIGAGFTYVKYILDNATKEPMKSSIDVDTLKKRMLYAMKIASKCESSISGPFIFIDTKDKQFTVEE